MALKLNDTFSAISQPKTALNCRGTVAIHLGAATVHDTTGAYAVTQGGIANVYVRFGSLSKLGAAEAVWRPLRVGVIVPAPLDGPDFYCTDYTDIRVVLTTLSVGALVPIIITDGSP